MAGLPPNAERHPAGFYQPRFGNVPKEPQMKQLTNAYNVYSADVVKQGGQLVMYCGGWMSEADIPHDGIYRAVMPSYKSVTKWDKVLAAGTLYQINDPVLVHMNGYWIMYLTGNSSFDPEHPINDIYYSTSWDGIGWGTPSLLVRGFAFASATLCGGRVFLCATSVYGAAWVYRFDLGVSGVEVGAPVMLTFPQLAYGYINIDVAYHPSINLWQMVAENLQGGGMSSTQIDYLYSWDGLFWSMGQAGIIRAAAGSSVRTPSMHPDSAYYVYYANSPTRDGMGNNVWFKDWS